MSHEVCYVPTSLENMDFSLHKSHNFCHGYCRTSYIHQCREPSSGIGYLGEWWATDDMHCSANLYKHPTIHLWMSGNMTSHLKLSLTMPCKQVQVTDIVATHHLQISQCATGTQHGHTDPLARLGWECNDFMATLYQTPNVKGTEVKMPQGKYEIVNLYFHILCMCLIKLLCLFLVWWPTKAATCCHRLYNIYSNKVVLILSTNYHNFGINSVAVVSVLS